MVITAEFSGFQRFEFDKKIDDLHNKINNDSDAIIKKLTLLHKEECYYEKSENLFFRFTVCIFTFFDRMWTWS